jgi:hypothetical protein
MASTASSGNPTLALTSVLTQLESTIEGLQESWLLFKGHKQPAQAVALVSALGDVLAPLFDAYVQSRDPVDRVHVAAQQLGTLHERLRQASDAPWFMHAQELLESCRRQLVEAETRLRQAPANHTAPLPLRASAGFPVLQRGSDVPILPASSNAVPPAAPAAAPIEPVPSGFSEDVLPALSHSEWVEFHTRDCLGDIVALLPQRTPQLGEAWAAADVIERRLVANLDAIASLGDEGYRAVEFASEHAVVVDSALCAGLALIAGSVASRDLLALCERLMLTWETDEAMWQAMADAWKLAPSPWLGALLDRFIRSPDARKQAVALEVLGYRSWLTAKDVQRLLEAKKAPLASVLPHLHHLSPPDRDSWLRRLYAESAVPNGEPALWWASALNGYPPLPAILEHAAPTDASGQAWLLLALYGERLHAEQMLAAFSQSPTPDLAFALGWAGLGGSIPVLIAALSSEDPILKGVVAMALERITAAGLYEEVPIAPEQAMTPDVPEPAVEPTSPSLASELGDPRDAPQEGSPDTIVMPAITQLTWAAYWQQNSARFVPANRYRCGLPASPTVFVDELEHALRTPGDRRLIHRELVMRTGRRVHFDPHQWVEEQRNSIEQWLQTARACPVPAGTWFRLPITF